MIFIQTIICNYIIEHNAKIGGGVAIDLSRLRARGESIKDIKGVAKGVIPVAKSLENGFGYADQLG